MQKSALCRVILFGVAALFMSACPSATQSAAMASAKKAGNLAIGSCIGADFSCVVSGAQQVVDASCDVNHCGVCAGSGAVCASGQVCAFGTCQTCASPLQACPANYTLNGAACSTCQSATCVSVTTDPNNCGSCGNKCASGSVCSNGNCCLAGQSYCNGKCISTSGDANNCGGCGISCSGAQNACVSGQCSCPTGTSLCGGACVNTTTNNNNCGSCGNVCSGSANQCVNGTCACASGTSLCPASGSNPAVCSNTQTDSNNCGSCGFACATGFQCVSGSCVTAYNLQTDNNNCGAVGNKCSTSVSASCVGGVCVCPAAGLAQCTTPSTSSTPGVITCVNEQTDVRNCGSCNNACPSVEVCTGGKCVCPTTYLPNYCSSTNTCVNTTNDNNNCGACGTKCPSSENCVNSVCTCTNSAQPSFCSTSTTNVCTNLQTDSKNCGACGVQCTAPQTCQGGKCLCTPTTNSLCLSASSTTSSQSYICTNEQTDNTNCNGCGSVCSAPFTCIGGVCGCPSYAPYAAALGGGGTCVCKASGATWNTSTRSCTCPQSPVPSTFNPAANSGNGGCTCPWGAQWNGSACTCASGLTWNPSSSQCVCTNCYDHNNCGSINNVCSANAPFCNSGNCISNWTCTTVSSGQSISLDLYNDSNNCGSYGSGCNNGSASVVCGSGQFCNYAQCIPNTSLDCSGNIVNSVASNNSVCGVCKNTCPTGTTCINGGCNPNS